MVHRGLAAAPIAGAVCTVAGWVTLVAGFAAGVAVAIVDDASDTERAARAILSFGIIVGAVVTWAGFVALGALVKIGLRLLEHRAG